MALHFSANQYEKNFKPTLLQNWEVPREYREIVYYRKKKAERPRAFLGFTQIVANDRGHLLTGVKRSRVSPWGTFVGTYDMPLKIPGNNMINDTARTELSVHKMQRLKSEGDIIIQGKLKQCKIPSPLQVKADRDADQTISPKGAEAITNLVQPSGSRSGEILLSATRNGERSGARAPEPKTSVGAVPRTPVKPCTPNLNWPRPQSSGQRVHSASPNMTSPKAALPPIASPKIANSPTPGTPIKWPSPRAVEDPMPV